MKLSKKKQDALYSAVYEEIMQARIRIARLLRDIHPQSVTVCRAVDGILYELTVDAPQKALNVFEQ